MDRETRIRALLGRGDLQGAATQVIEAYGAEVLGFLVAMTGDREDAEEVMAQASADLWLGIGGFGQRASARTWFYALARHAALRLLRRRRMRRTRHISLSEAGELVERTRSSTDTHLRTEVRDGFAAIREALPADDRALLVLRVDRGLSWLDVSRVLAGEVDDAELDRVAARLRKRFQSLKRHIRARARAAGLVR